MWSAEKPGAPVKVVPSSGEELLFPAVSAQGRRLVYARSATDANILRLVLHIHVSGLQAVKT